jgi:PAS domain S-box-containing protein
VIRRYSIAFLSVAAALGLAFLLRRFEGMAVASFLIAIALTFWHAGLGAGFLAIVLSILCMDYFFTPPLYRFTADVSNLPYIVIFTLFGLVFSWFSVSRRSAEQQLRQAQKELEVKVAERTAALRRSDALLTEGERLTRTGTWAFNPATKAFVFWSAESYRLFGFEPEKGAPSFEEWTQRIHPDDRESVLRPLESRGADDYKAEFRIVLPDGSIRYIQGAGHPVFNASGELVEFVGSATDVTERKRIEEALRQTEYYLTEGERLTHTGSYAWSAVKGLVHASAELIRVFGFDPEEPTPPHAAFRERVHPDDLAMFDALEERTTREGTDLDWDYRILLPDGTLKYLHVVARPVFNASGEIVGNIGATGDVTERIRSEQDRERLRELESNLARINRVSMMGELTASLGHEIKQPITAVVSNAEACLQWLSREQPDLAEVREAAADMVKEAMRAAENMTRIHSLFKKEEIKREVLDVNEVIAHTVSLIREEADRSSISMRTELDAQLPSISADRVQLQQVLMNLTLNGLEAMKPSGGELFIRSQRDEKGQALISVSDAGVGLPVADRDKIFDALFTTKPRGTGMGLAISRSIVESYGGRLWATTNSGQGATFYFTLANADGEKE